MSDDFECTLREIAFRLEAVSSICRTVAKNHRGTPNQGVNYLKSMLDTDDMAYIETFVEVVNGK